MKKASWLILAVMLVAGAGAWLLSNGKPAEASGNASFSLSPASGSYATGATVTVALSENSTAGDNVNAVSVNLTYPAGLLSWQSTNLTGPFTLCALNAHGSGTVNLACAATVAQNGTQAIATVSFTVLAAGNAQVALASGSDIDNTSGQSVWNGALPSATYGLSAPAGSSSGSHSSTTTSSSKSSPAKPSTSASPTPTGSPSPSPSASPTASPSPEGTGSISITVSDDSGRVSGATADLDGQFGTTNGSGVVNFAGINSGSHSLTITATGDKSFSTTISLDAGQNKLVSYKLIKDATGSQNIWLWAAAAGGGLALLGGLGGLLYFKVYRPRRLPTTNVPAPMSATPAVPATPVAPVAPPAPVAPVAPPPPPAPAPGPNDQPPTL